MPIISRGGAEARRSDDFFARKERKGHKEAAHAAGNLNIIATAPFAMFDKKGGFAAGAASLWSLRPLRETPCSFSLRVSAPPREQIGAAA